MVNFETSSGSRWVIRHETTYRYDTPVAFAPHTLRLSPRADSVRTLARELRVTPSPVEVADFPDEFGNTCSRVTFDTNAVNELTVESRVEVQICAPQRHLLSSFSLPQLPWTPPSGDRLAVFRQTDGSVDVSALAFRVSAEVGGAPLAFFEHLNRTLYSTIDRQIRVEGSAQTPAQTPAKQV